MSEYVDLDAREDVVQDVKEEDEAVDLTQPIQEDFIVDDASVEVDPTFSHAAVDQQLEKKDIDERIRELRERYSTKKTNKRKVEERVEEKKEEKEVSLK